MAKDVLVKTRFKTVPSLSPTYIQRSKSTHSAQILEIHPLMRHSSNPAAWPGLHLHGGAWAPPLQVRFNRILDTGVPDLSSIWGTSELSFYQFINIQFFLHNPQICSHSSLCDAQISFRRNHCASPPTNWRCSEKCLFQCSSNYARGSSSSWHVLHSLSAPGGRAGHLARRAAGRRPTWLGAARSVGCGFTALYYT